jgi:ubiquinone/menaquinone biosynthesis C-methylase UbiE
MAERSGLTFDAALIDTVLPLVEGLPERLRSGAEVADVGCGSGHAVNLMARAFPASRFTGLDFSAEAVAAGIAEATRLGLSNAAFAQADLTRLEDEAVYDVITAFDTIHDQAQPRRVLANIFRALRPGGIFLMADSRASSKLEENIDLPLSTWMYTVSTMHCMTVSLAYDGEGLGTAWGRQLAVAMLGDAGFADVRVEEIRGDPRNYYYIARR